MKKQPSVAKQWKAAVKHDTCAICKAIDGSYRILFKHADGTVRCLGCEKRAREQKAVDITNERQ